LVNGPDAAAGARLSSTSAGSLGVGVHLNILRGRPESPAHEIPGLVNGEGLFLGDYAALFKRYLARAFTPADDEAGAPPTAMLTTSLHSPTRLSFTR
jgi:predicted glycoside hydrolase/deacetylase ChbG (UPF0249 family)